MTAHLSRRPPRLAVPGLAAPVALLPASMAEAAFAPALLPAPDPLPGLLARCEQHRQDWLAASDAFGEDSPQDKAAFDAFTATERLIETTVATTPEGVAAQIEHMKRSYVGSSYGVPNTRTDEVPVAFLDVILSGLRGLP